jgi:beta-glucosidase
MRFPDGFFWGAATAAHQVEGCNTHSDWWRAEQSGRLPHRSEDACDSWNRWPEDVRLLADIGLNAYRMSVEWARIQPEPGRFDQAALDTYRRLLEALRAEHIEPMVTLHHFVNPDWLADRGGWENPDVVPYFETYVERVARELGPLVRWWVTINEPSILGLKAYIEGSWPPFMRAYPRGYVRLMRHALRAHAAGRRALREVRSDALVSMAYALWPMEPLRAWSPVDQVMACVGDWLWQGRVLRRALPRLDWIGVNYYSRNVVGFPPGAHVAAERTDFGWEIYPRGLYNVLRRVGRLRKPVVITENGIADADDDQRARYIVQHLVEAQRALADGVDLRGYMHWSLLDNFEWAEGFSMQFGLATRDRRLRASARAYGAIARANALTPEALALTR